VPIALDGQPVDLVVSVESGGLEAGSADSSTTAAIPLVVNSKSLEVRRLQSRVPRRRRGKTVPRSTWTAVVPSASGTNGSPGGMAAETISA
jgi:hypothetical protein